MNEDALVGAAQDGDRDALEVLLRQHYDRIHAVCRRIVGRSGDADDAAQEATISIVRALARFDGRSSFGTWAYRIATNAAFDELRRRSRRPQLHVAGTGEDDDGHVPEPADPGAALRVDAAGDRIDIDAALASLPEDFRAAVVLRDVCDLDYAEIADALDIPLGTVKSRIARGRGLVATALRPPDPDTAGNQQAGSERPTNPSPAAAPTEPRSDGTRRSPADAGDEPR